MHADTPIHLTPMVRAWQCRKRGLCCRGQGVQIDEVERRRLERRLREVGDPLADALTSDNVRREHGWPVLPRVSDHCAFLGEDNLCGVRTRLGDAVYPRVCRKFPYLSILTNDRQIVDLTFLCPTALQLLAEETCVTVGVEHGEAPVESVAWLGDAERECWDIAGKRIPIDEFWALHWSLFARFEARPEADPWQRLVAFAEDVTGLEAPAPLVMPRAFLKQGAFEPSIASALGELVGGTPRGLTWLWLHSPPQDYTLDPLPELDEHALITRYLMHRFLCPTFYLAFADPRYLLMTMFAMLARYRIERERGYDVLAAVRQLDRYFVHTATATTLFDGESTFEPWRAMAALARAVTPD